MNAKRILVVEDVAGILCAMEAMETERLFIVPTSTLDEAKAKYDEGGVYDAIIIDIHLPNHVHSVRDNVPLIIREKWKFRGQIIVMSADASALAEMKKNPCCNLCIPKGEELVKFLQEQGGGADTLKLAAR